MKWEIGYSRDGHPRPLVFIDLETIEDVRRLIVKQNKPITFRIIDWPGEDGFRYLIDIKD